MLGQHQFSSSQAVVNDAGLNILAHLSVPVTLDGMRAIFFFHGRTLRYGVTAGLDYYVVTWFDARIFGWISCISNLYNGVTDDDKSSLTGKGPSAECVMSHFAASQFPTIRWAVAILKTSCEDVLLTQVEIWQHNDQTLKTPLRTTCNKKEAWKSDLIFARPVDVDAAFLM